MTDPSTSDLLILDAAAAATAVLVAHLGGSADPEGWWPNDDEDAFAVALGQAAIANDLVDDDQNGDEVEPHRSLVAYLDALAFDTLLILTNDDAPEVTGRLTGHAAIARAELHGHDLSKYADPVEGAREGLTVSEALAVASEDPGLIYLDIGSTSTIPGSSGR